MERKLSKREIGVARWFRRSKFNQLLMVLGQMFVALVVVILLQWAWPAGQTWGEILVFDSIIVWPAGFFLWIIDCVSTPSLEELDRKD